MKKIDISKDDKDEDQWWYLCNTTENVSLWLQFILSLGVSKRWNIYTFVTQYVLQDLSTCESNVHPESLNKMQCRISNEQTATESSS